MYVASTQLLGAVLVHPGLVIVMVPVAISVDAGGTCVVTTRESFAPGSMVHTLRFWET